MPDLLMKARLMKAWWCMLLTMVLVFIRNIYRIVEFAGGQHSAIDQTEAPYMVLDLLMMAICGAVFAVLNLGSDDVLPPEIRQGKRKPSTAAVESAETKDVEMGDTKQMGKVEQVVEVRA